MIYVLYIIATLYAVLCVLAPLLKVKEWKKCPSLVSMLVGGMTLITSMVLKSSGNRNAWILAVLALICIAISAWINGGVQGKRHLSHHIVRWGLSLLIVLGFVLL